jgi:hypothetical protein
MDVGRRLGWPGGVEIQRHRMGRRSTTAECSVSAAKRRWRL